MRRTQAHLAVVLHGMPVRGDRLEVAEKTTSGVAAIAEHWPGRVTVVAPPIAADQGGNLGRTWVRTADLPTEFVAADPVDWVRRHRPDVAQLPFDVRFAAIGALVPSVVMAENPARERLAYAWPTAPWTHRPRMVAGAAKQAAALRRMIDAAAAVACNGWAAWSAYGRRRRAHLVEPLLFFDSRLPRAEIDEARARRDARRWEGRPLSLAFSGQLHPAKGPQHAVRASALLDRAGVEHRLSLLGAGRLEDELRSVAGPSVRFLGALPFTPDWVRFIRDEVDLMVLPHVQGDPSGTYVEAAGLGVPVAGFANRALRGHARQGFGLLARARSAAALARLLEELDGDRERIRLAGLRGAAFMATRGYESEFARRVEQMIAVAYRSR